MKYTIRLFIQSVIMLLFLICTFSLSGCGEGLGGLLDPSAYQMNEEENQDGPDNTDDNRSPILDPIGSKAIDEEQLLEFTISASDPDGDELTYSASNLPTGANFDTLTNVFSWTPAYNQSGNYTDVLFIVTDNGSPPSSASEAITISVGNVNLPPVLDPISNRSVDEGDALQFTVTAVDPNTWDVLTFSATNLPSGAVFDPNTQEFSWTPGYNQSGNYSGVRFTVTDDGIPQESDFEEIVISVGDVNRPPVLDPIGNRSVDENALLQFIITATDPDGHNISYAASNLPSGATFNTGTQTFSWTPTYEQSGSFPGVLFTATDDGIPNESDSESITITVNNVNRAPVLIPIGNKSVNEGELLEFTINANDPDAGNVLTFSANNLPVGSSFDPVTRKFSWTPDFDDSGSYPNVRFTVEDNGVPVLDDFEDITITVNNVNRAPVLDPIGNKEVAEGVELSFTVTASDPDVGNTLTYSATNLPIGANFDTGTQVFSWTPNFGDAGNYPNVRFTVEDDGAPVLDDFEEITITVGNVNRPPVLDAIGNKTVTEGDLLQFTITASDPDVGDTLTYSATNLPAGANFDTGTQVFSWTPNYTQSGTYTSVRFTVEDDGAPILSDFEEITITVDNREWWNTSWNYRNEITVTEQAWSGDLNDYQINVNLNSSNFDFSKADINGDDIRFTYYDLGTETEIDYWIESWNFGAELASIWVEVTNVPEGLPATIYMYYGNGSAGAGSDFDDTFTKDYGASGLMGMWHIDEGAGNSNIADISGNGNTGTINGAAWVGTDGGQWSNRSDVVFSTGDSLDFDGATDYVEVSDSASLDVNRVTIGAWFKGEAGVGVPSQTEILRPNGAGSETSIVNQDPGSGSHWELVDDVTSDDNNTFVYQSGSLEDEIWRRDLYSIPDHSKGSGVINKITIHYRVKRYVSSNRSAWAQASLRTYGTTYDGTAYSITSFETWTNYSEEVLTNPNTGSAWTWDEIDALEIGVRLRMNYFFLIGSRAACTQVYVEVDYTPPATIIGKGEDAYKIGIDENNYLWGFINNKTVCAQLINPATTWHYLALSYDGTNECLYVDGVLEDSRTFYESITVNTDNLLIGEYVNGIIDEVSVYDRGFGVDEIISYYERRQHSNPEPQVSIGGEESL